MIQLTRLRHGDTMFLNPDLFERVDTHVDTVVRMTDGTEYVVIEPAEEIVRRIIDLRARIIAIAGMMQSGAVVWTYPGDPGAHAHPEPVRELARPSAANPSDAGRPDESP